MAARSQDTRRLPALDGLRGIAAMVVLVCHAFLISPVLAGAYLKGDPGHGPLWAQALKYTPLHVVWAGTESVYVFFVLSGFVLTMPAVTGRQSPWRSYYPQRLTRLYVPIVAAVAIGYGLVHVGTRTSAPWRSWWLNAHPATIGLRALARDATVVSGAGATNSALWSLQAEVIFSLLLPVFILLFVRVRMPVVVRGAIVFVLLAGGEIVGHPSLFIAGIFAAGVIMSRHHALLRSAGRRFDAARTSIKVAFGVIATVLLTARWPLIASGHPGGVGEVASVVGSCLVVWCFATTSVGHAAGTQRVVAWIGHRSFSLYLVHEPIIVTTAVLLGRRANPVVVLAISLPVSLVVAAAFYRIVEHPSHRAAKWIGQVMAPPRSEPTTVTPHDASESHL